jgi:hypothetical protein
MGSSEKSKFQVRKPSDSNTAVRKARQTCIKIMISRSLFSLPYSIHLMQCCIGMYEIMFPRTSFGRLVMNDGVEDVDGASISVIDALVSGG